VFFVKADSKGVASALGVKALDKGLSGAFFSPLILSWNKGAGAGTAYFAQRSAKLMGAKELDVLRGL
jgi:hypothetical protein